MDFIQSKFHQKQQNRRGSADESPIISNERLNYEISRSSFERLQPGRWLNDEVINAYIKLINDRTAQKSLTNAYVMNTFFYTMLEEMAKRGDYSFAKIERCLRRQKVDLKAYALTLIPVNLTHSHWLFLAVDFKAWTVYVIDSIGCAQELAQGYLDVVRPFLNDFQGNSSIEWTIEVTQSIPKQLNGFDCGLCTCVNMELLSRTNASQTGLMFFDTRKAIGSIRYDMGDHMFSEDARKRVAVELMFGELLTSVEQQQQ
ncbi:hypothetical protein FGO68_gene15811 [Halteria grandinella]|uniref:Ubiquitin-like protease family profile domain-containing protein n=1 Tax=Halteria grandinella TaxID=5974 RepID=A0A8J8NS82_HALGN|nr:hypothetical protein FGO68_gene15811 [Halteria grandinella]